MAERRSRTEQAAMCLKGQTSLEWTASTARHLRGQMSLEALVSFAALLSALGLLIVSADRLSRDFSNSIDSSSQKLIVSQEALSLDTAGFCASGAIFQKNISSVPSSDGWRIASPSSPAIQEAVFGKVSAGADGKIHVQGKEAEPV